MLFPAAGLLGEPFDRTAASMRSFRDKALERTGGRLTGPGFSASGFRPDLEM